MPDNLLHRSGDSQARIDVTDPRAMQDWAEKFGVTPEQLKDAVLAVGERADEVHDYLIAGGARERKDVQGHRGGRSG